MGVAATGPVVQQSSKLACVRSSPAPTLLQSPRLRPARARCSRRSPTREPALDQHGARAAVASDHPRLSLSLSSTASASLHRALLPRAAAATATATMLLLLLYMLSHAGQHAGAQCTRHRHAARRPVKGLTSLMAAAGSCLRLAATVERSPAAAGYSRSLPACSAQADLTHSLSCGSVSVAVDADELSAHRHGPPWRGFVARWPFSSWTTDCRPVVATHATYQGRWSVVCSPPVPA